MTSYADANDFRTHVRDEHPKFKYINVLKSFLSSYRPMYLDISDLTCKSCDKRLGNLDEFIDHIIDSHEIVFDRSCLDAFLCFKLTNLKISCLSCRAEFEFFGSLLNHVFKAHSQDRRGLLLCDHCGKGFQRQYLLSKHIKDAHEQSGYKCRHCSKSFQREHQWRYHELSVHKERKFKCKECGASFYGHNQKVQHLRTVHKVGCVKCDLCDKQFPVLSQLVYHKKRVHLKEKNCVCGVCGRSFFSESGLKLHMVSHGDEKPFECRFCKKAFARRTNLVVHERIHTNDKRCVCKVCGEAFIQTASLKLHMKKHWAASNNDSSAI